MARQALDTKVVDLLRYRSARQTHPLPLFDGPPLTDVPRLATIAPFRVLSARDVAHRARMLAHLRAAPSRNL